MADLARLSTPSGSPDPMITKLVASKCDFPAFGANVDPRKCLNKELAKAVSSPEALFGDNRYRLPAPPALRPYEVPEYCKVVTRQIRANLVTLATSVLGGAQLFGRVKDAMHTRVIFSGSALSEAANEPPAPRMLASPTSLTWLESCESEPLSGTKRDGAKMFDQLQLNPCFRPYLAQAGIRVSDLLAHSDITLSEVQTALPRGCSISNNSVVYPCSNTWRMGFSHSSAVCQDVTLNVCWEAGLDPTQVLADGVMPPDDTSTCFGAATDDIAIYSRGGPDSSMQWGSRLDHAFQKTRVVRNPAKDENGVADMRFIGIDLIRGRFLAPAVEKTVLFIGMVHMLVTASQVIPRHLSAAVGLPSWYAQLVRPLYAVFGAIYDTTRLDDQETPVQLSAAQKGELLAAAVLSTVCELDTTDPWASQVLATDASPSFGFGLKAAPTTDSEARALGRRSWDRSVFVRPSGDDLLGVEELPRQGTCHRLSFDRSRFRTILSSKATHVAHAGALEATGVVLAARWLSRSAASHSRRTVLLVDAQAVLGAAKKGRSSSRSLRHPLRRLAAELLATGIRLFLLYVPSESNPADPPSRGKRSLL